MDLVSHCPSCKYQIVSEWYFCPNCGKMLKEKPVVISVLKQIVIYLVSFFLAPLGLGWGLKYIWNKDIKVKTIGIISIILTIASISLMFLIFKSFMDQYSKILNNIQSY